MGGVFHAWPPEALVALLALIATWAGGLCRSLFRWRRSSQDGDSKIHEQGWKRVHELDEEIIQLRKVLDSGRRRESAYITGLELALIAMRLPEQEQAEIVARVRQIISAALRPSGSGG